MKVQAAPGMKCPIEGNPRKFITDAAPIDVPESAYYKRLVGDGSLRVATDKPARKKEATADGK
jgi:hypothetical protein